jgi:hypothetical protein
MRALWGEGKTVEGLRLAGEVFYQTRLWGEGKTCAWKD